MNTFDQTVLSIFLLLSCSANAEQTKNNGYNELMIDDSDKEMKVKRENTPILTSMQKCNLNAFKNKTNEANSGTNICLTVNGKSIVATLNNSATSKDLISKLPLSLRFEDYANTEKISYLPAKLTIAGSPSGVTPAVGEITYYAPWGNLAIFYKDSNVGFAKGLIRLGSIHSGLENLVKANGSTVTIEKVE